MQGTQYAAKRSILCRGAFSGSTLLPLQITCSLVVAKLISESCASPRPDSEKLKREPQSLGCCLVGSM